MKISLCAVTLMGLLATTHLEASPLAKKHVSADAKWLLHLDLDNFRETKIGAFMTKEILEKKAQKQLDQMASQLKSKPQIDLKKIRSITAYGVDYESEHNGVLLIHAGQDLQTVVDGLVGEGDSGGFLKKSQDASQTFYSLHDDDLFISFASKDLLLIGKSKGQIEKALQVVAGKSPNLTASDSFAGLSGTPNSFFFVAVAEAFNAKSVLPPQAKVLQMAEGGRLVLGEKSDKLFLDLALRAKTAELSTQIQQIVQGMIALVTLSQNENPDLTQLAQSIKVSAADNVVTLALEYPVAKAIEKLSAELPKMNVNVKPSDNKEGKGKSKEDEK